MTAKDREHYHGVWCDDRDPHHHVFYTKVEHFAGNDTELYDCLCTLAKLLFLLCKVAK